MIASLKDGIAEMKELLEHGSDVSTESYGKLQAYCDDLLNEIPNEDIEKWLNYEQCSEFLQSHDLTYIEDDVGKMLAEVNKEGDRRVYLAGYIDALMDFEIIGSNVRDYLYALYGN